MSAELDRLKQTRELLITELDELHHVPPDSIWPTSRWRTGIVEMRLFDPTQGEPPKSKLPKTVAERRVFLRQMVVDIDKEIQQVTKLARGGK